MAAERLSTAVARELDRIGGHGFTGCVVHLPAALIASEAKRGLDLYAIARQCGVELRTVEQDEIKIEEAEVTP